MAARGARATAGYAGDWLHGHRVGQHNSRGAPHVPVGLTLPGHPFGGRCQRILLRSPISPALFVTGLTKAGLSKDQMMTAGREADRQVADGLSWLSLDLWGSFGGLSGSIQRWSRVKDRLSFCFQRATGRSMSDLTTAEIAAFTAVVLLLVVTFVLLRR